MTVGATARTDTPDVSIVMPCYNEQAIVAFTVSKLCDAFDRAGHRFELIAVDNGSTDRTGSVLAGLGEK